VRRGDAMSRGAVLVVEDHGVARQALACVLEASGYAVRQAATAADALASAADGNVALVLLDLGLPDADGIEVVRRLRADPGTRSIPVVALTGRGEEWGEVCGGEGCAAFLTKPVAPRQLLATVARLVGAPGA